MLSIVLESSWFNFKHKPYSTQLYIEGKTHMTKKKIIGLIFMCSLSLSQNVFADIFQYTDQSGTVVMVDDESKVPAKFRNKTRISKFASNGDNTTTAVRIKNNQVFVPVSFNYRGKIVETWLLLDTGATTTTITTELAHRLGIKQSNTQRQLSRVADGRVVQSFMSDVDYISVGSKTKHSTKITIMPTDSGLGFDGLLGMNFLSDFPYRLDMQTHVIKWLE